MFPGYADLIAAEWERLEHADEDGASGSGDGFPAVLRDFGAYCIERELGRGGQGFVYLARDERLNRPVALKVLTTSSVDPDSRRRLLREAESASRLDHPNICAVYDVGEEGGLPFIAMRFIEGRTLATVIAERRAACDGSADDGPGREDVDYGVAIVEKVARALDVAHEKGVVHRDVKPGNIMITPDGEPVVLDFGMAREEQGATLTQTGQLLGTPAYMSPEQLLGGRVIVDRRADVYALGVTLFECVTLRRPIEASTREQLYQRIVVHEPTNPRRFNRAVHPDLHAILDRALEKDPDRRYQTAGELADDLGRLQRNEPVLARHVSPIARTVRLARRKPVHAALVALLIVGVPLVAALLGFYVASRDDVRTAEAVRRERLVERLLVEGLTHVHDGDHQAAIERFERVLEVNPASQEAVAELARAHVSLGKPAEALAVLERHVAPDDQSGLLLVRASVLSANGRKDEALALGARWQKRPKDALGYFQAGSAALSSGHNGHETSYSNALEWMTRAVHSSPRARFAYHIQWAHAAGHAEDEREAQRAADALIHLWPDAPLAWCWRGYALMRIGRYEAAERALARCLSMKSYWGVTYNLSLVKSQRGDRVGAERLLREAIAMNPKHAPAHVNLAALVAARGAVAESVEHLRRGIALDPKSDWYVRLGHSLLLLERLDESERAFRTARDRGERTARVHTGLGRIMVARGEHAAALACFEEALAVDESFVTALCAAATAANRTGRLDRAVTYAERAIACRPESTDAQASAHFELGIALTQTRRFAEALEHYREAARLRPADAPTRSNLGLLLTKLRRYDEAIDAFEDALALDADLGEALSGLGIVHLREGRLDEAETFLRRAAAASPKLFGARYDLGVLLGRRGEYDQALRHLRAAARLMPKDPRASFEQGKILAAQRDHAGAAACMRDAIERAPTFAEAHCNLGHYLRALGDSAAALSPFATGHRLGKARGPSWRYPSKRWVDDCERAVFKAALRRLRGVVGNTAGDRLDASRTARDEVEALLGHWRRAAANGDDAPARLRNKVNRVLDDGIVAAVGEDDSLPPAERKAWRTLAGSLTAFATGLPNR